MNATIAPRMLMSEPFFGHLCGDSALVRAVSDRAFAKAPSRQHMPALAWPNEQLVARADAAGPAQAPQA